jgi:NADH dehydrogenase
VDVVASAGDAEVRERIPTKTVLWAAGVLAAMFARTVAAETGADVDRAGRLHVNTDLTIDGHPEILVLGDAAVIPWQDERPVPGVAQGAIQSGKYAAKAIRRRLDGQPIGAFRYQDRGDVAVIGRLAGVTNIGWLGPFGRQSGFPAWVLWLLIHIAYLIGFANRVVVLVRWAWSFFTHGRASRLITGTPFLPPIERPGPTPQEPVTASAPDPEPAEPAAEPLAKP